MNTFILQGNIKQLEKLIRQGSVLNVDLTNYAIQHGNIDVIELLLDYDAPMDKTSVLLSPSLEIADLLLSHGAPIDEFTLQYAIQFDNSQLIDLLIDYIPVEELSEEDFEFIRERAAKKFSNEHLKRQGLIKNKYSTTEELNLLPPLSNFPGGTYYHLAAERFA